MKEINEIRSQIGQLKSKIRDAEARLEDAGLRHLGLSRGDIIKTPRGLVCVTGCVAGWSSAPRPEGVKVKKDGTAGAQSAGYIREWTKP